MPIFLVTMFAKNEKDNLTRAEQAAAVELGAGRNLWRLMMSV